jgi:hypothetical protein
LHLNRNINTRSQTTLNDSIYLRSKLEDDEFSLDLQKYNTEKELDKKHDIINLQEPSEIQSNKFKTLNLLKPKSVQNDDFSHISVKDHSSHATKNVTFDVQSASIDDYAFIDKKKHR